MIFPRDRRPSNSHLLERVRATPTAPPVKSALWGRWPLQCTIHWGPAHYVAVKLNYEYSNL